MSVKDWSVTAASNTAIFAGISTDGTVMTVNQMDDAFREMAAQIASQLGKMGFEGADIASATTTNLANATGWSLDVTGTTTITGLGTVDAGQIFILRFTGALTFTHNATSLILPTAANITTAAGDVFVMKSEGSGNWRCVMYQPAAGYPRLSTANTWTGTQTVTAVDNGITTTPLLIKNSAGSQTAGYGAYGITASPIAFTLPNTTQISSANNNLGPAYLQFTDVNGGDRLGYVGAGSSSTANIDLLSDIGAIRIISATTIAMTGNTTLTGTFSSAALSATTGTFSSTLQGTVVTATTAFRSAAGSAATPGYSVAGDTNTGLFFPIADEVAMSSGGSEIWRTNSSGLNVGRENVLSMAAAEYGLSLETSGLLQVARLGAAAMGLKRSNDGALVNIFNGTTQVGSISVSAAATAYNTSSDGRLKKNLRDFDSGGFLDALEVWHFDWTAGGSGYGVIAQDAHKVFPDAISQPEGKNDHWKADYSKFVPLLLAEVKALRARVKALET